VGTGVLIRHRQADTNCDLATAGIAGNCAVTHSHVVWCDCYFITFRSCLHYKREEDSTVFLTLAVVVDFILVDSALFVIVKAGLLALEPVAKQTWPILLSTQHEHWKEQPVASFLSALYRHTRWKLFNQRTCYSLKTVQTHKQLQILWT